MNAGERRRAALLARVDGLAADLDHWLALTAKSTSGARGAGQAGAGQGGAGRGGAGAPFPQHHTQVLAVNAALRPLLDRVREAETRRADTELGLLQEVWWRLRGALTQRHDRSLGDFLLLADDFVWSCYRPALTAASSVSGAEILPVEPPLVHLTAHAVPFALPRLVSEDRQARVDELLRALPVPLVGLPFVQSRHLPEAVLAAHEVGHCVLDAFGLTGELSEVLRRTAEGPDWWTDRLPEVFADLYGALCAGSGFAFILADFVALTPEGPPSPRYPAPRVRVALVADALAEAGGEEAAKELRAHWAEHAAGRGPAPEGLRPTVRALLSAPLTALGGSTLLDLFPRGVDANLRAAADALLRRSPIPRSVPETAGVLLPAAAFAFHTDPDRYAKVVKDLTDRIFRLVAEDRTRGVRGGAGGGEATDTPGDRGARSASRLRALLDGWGADPPADAAS
ncbi:hypothetical protein [Kitasatospora sp. NPDC002965]|uniref:hypothetical protein n=1 Tax=Kitasatospora sp. NPDC002965 TaxID=3154775 RepID=UPI0033BBB319